MQIDMIGLGRMGGNLERRLLGDGDQPVVYDVDSEAVSELVAAGAEGATSSGDLTSTLVASRPVWVVRSQFGGHAENGEME